MKNKAVKFDCFYNSLREKVHTGKSFKKGKFQKWGESFTNVENKYFAITIAIILGDDDKIYCVPPNSITVIK